MPGRLELEPHQPPREGTSSCPRRVIASDSAHPRRRVVHPAAADHGRDDLDVRSSSGSTSSDPGRARRGLRGGPARADPAALVAREPRRRDARRLERLGHRDRVLGMPRSRRRSSAATPRGPQPRVELLDRRVGAVRDQRARVEQLAEAVRARAGPPRSARRGRGRTGRAELDRGGDPQLREAGEVLGREQLRVLDPLAQPERLPDLAGASNASSASRFARSPIACTATGKPARAPRRRSPRAPRRS